MKLRNKKTGEIADLLWVINHTGNKRDTFTLAELNKEWEDYEEPKELERYIVDTFGNILPTNDVTNFSLWKLRQIGNEFETEEEAKKAVEKLKAWKRLKDKGFRFECYTRRSDVAMLPEVRALKNLIDITAYLPSNKIEEMEADLYLLFGGEE